MTDCIFCEEPVLPEDESDESVNGKPVHRECIIRSVLGTVAHAQKRCRCFIAGSTDSDPIGMSKRDAARAAVKAHRFASVGAQLLNIEGRCPECGCAEFNPGPRGGRARNIRCASCGVKYWYCPPFPPQLIFFSDDEFYNTSVRPHAPIPGGCMNLHETPAFTLVNWLIFTIVAALFVALVQALIRWRVLRGEGWRQAFDGFWTRYVYALGSSAFAAAVVLFMANLGQ